jgi:hypothetical protein
MTESGFARLEATDEVMFGPRALLCTGYTPEEQALLTALVTAAGLRELPCSFASAEHASLTVGELLRRGATGHPHLAGNEERTEPGEQRLVLFSGVRERELHAFIHAYRGSGLPRPLWATATEQSVTWSLSALLRELEQERASLAPRG